MKYFVTSVTFIKVFSTLVR